LGRVYHFRCCIYIVNLGYWSRVTAFLNNVDTAKQYRLVLLEVANPRLLDHVNWLYVPTPFGIGRDPSFLLRLETLWIPAVLYGLAIAFAAVAYIKFRKK